MPPLWCLSAATVTHDQAAATISYQDAQFELFGVPILYTPYFEHADPSVKRKSGFLMPQPTISDNLGYSTTIPYYFALAPNYDFTFYPMYTSRQGILWQGEWRHRTENGQYFIRGTGIDQDAADLPSSIQDRDAVRRLARQPRDQGPVQPRELVEVRLGHHHRKRRRVPALLQARQHSADRPRQQDVLRRPVGPQLLRARGLRVHGPRLSNPGTPRPSSTRIRSWTTTTCSPIRSSAASCSWNTNALSLSSNQDPTIFAPFADGNQQMNRVVTELNWRRRLTDPIGITYTPFAQLRGDLYQIEQLHRSATPSTSRPRTPRWPAASLLGGVTIAYPWVANTQLWVARHRADRPDHRPPGAHRSEQLAERGRAEPRVRRHQPVRGDQVLRL